MPHNSSPSSMLVGFVSLHSTSHLCGDAVEDLHFIQIATIPLISAEI